MSCYKTSYESEGMALATQDILIENGVKNADKLNVYKCDKCDFWHFTSIKQL